MTDTNTTREAAPRLWIGIRGVAKYQQDMKDRQYVRADIAEQEKAAAVAAALEAVKVKPLVWKWHRDPKDTSEARTTIGSWTVWEIDGSGYCYGPDDLRGKPCDGGIQGAMETAQADYERRIREALEPHTNALIPDMEAALLAAEELAKAAKTWAIYDSDLQHALTAYRAAIIEETDHD